MGLNTADGKRRSEVMVELEPRTLLSGLVVGESMLVVMRDRDKALVGKSTELGFAKSVLGLSWKITTGRPAGRAALECGRLCQKWQSGPGAWLSSARR